MLQKRIKAFIATSIAALTLSFLCISPVRADTTDDLLQAILTATNSILTNLNTYIAAFAAFSSAWLSGDTTDATANLQTNFTTYSNLMLQNITDQVAQQPSLNQSYFNTPPLPNKIPNYMTYANEVTFSTLLGQPYTTATQTDSYGNTVDLNTSMINYIKNASGLTITHPIPDQTWGGKQFNKQRYLNYYKTISAVQSFNNYLLSDLYANAKNGNQLTTLQATLIQQATSPDWFKSVGSENIGVVLRQLLLYNSQMYVMMNSMLQTEKQALTAQAMTNTLIILGNQFNEDNLVGKATGSIPG